jgi:HSP20 family molecular chaperone IbpA
MPTIIPTHQSSSPVSLESAAAYQQPHFECTDLPQALKISVLVPGVDAAGVEIVSRGPDLVITARKAHIVRVNWQALHLEGVQRDYRLSLRLGRGFDFDELTAGIRDGVLTLDVPKRADATERHVLRQRRVA